MLLLVPDSVFYFFLENPVAFCPGHTPCVSLQVEMPRFGDQDSNPYRRRASHAGTWYSDSGPLLGQQLTGTAMECGNSVLPALLMVQLGQPPMLKHGAVTILGGGQFSPPLPPVNT